MDPSLPQIHGVPLTEPNITIIPAGGNQKPFILRFMYYGIDHPHNVPQNFKAHKVAEAASEILKQHDGIEPTDIFECYKQATANARLVSWQHTPVTQSIADQLHDKHTVNTTTPFQPDAVTEAILSPDTQVLLAHVRRLAHENPLEDLVKALDVVQSPPHIHWNFWPSRNASTEILQFSRPIPSVSWPRAPIVRARAVRAGLLVVGQTDPGSADLAEYFGLQGPG